MMTQLVAEDREARSLRSHFAWGPVALRLEYQESRWTMCT